MKTQILTITCAILLLNLPAAARLGETPTQCNERYGVPVREIAGGNGVAGARVYNKQGMEIIAIFVTRISLDPCVGMILYNTNTNRITRVGAMKAEVESPLLTTVPGRWEPYAAPPTLNSSTQGKQMRPTTSQLEQYRETCRLTLDAIVKVLYPPSVYPGMVALPPDIGHIGTDKFAFRVADGLAIVSYNAVPAIQKWSEGLPRRTTKRPAPLPNDLSGF
jgi:hypothetical protein